MNAAAHGTTAGAWAKTAAVFVIVSLALVVTGANYSKHQDVLRKMETQQEEEQMQKQTTTWVSAGLTQTLTTPRLEGEGAPEWMARHKEGLDAALAVFPKDPPAGG